MFAIVGKLKVPAKQAIARRVKWQYPPGMRVVGEYWINSNDPSLVIIVDAENDDALLKLRADWDDDFEIAVYSAMTAEHGLQVAKQLAA